MKSKNERTIRIGGGQGFWGDWLEAPINLATSGRLDYLILDYLAEVTMSILAKQKSKNENLGYGRDFPNLVLKLNKSIKSDNLKIIANAGGLNPLACAKACISEFKNAFPNEPLPKIAIVNGDNILGCVDDLYKKGEAFSHLETQAPISQVSNSLKSLNAYIGSASIVEALEAGAQIIITGRVADPSMCLAPLVHEFKWKQDDWDLLASGIVAGHVIECGAQSSGGNFSLDWENVPELWNLGYPIVECSKDGSFIVTKAEKTGGLVNKQTVSEQLVYEISDPKNYITPDVVVDFTSLELLDIDKNKVQVKGAKGKKHTDFYKVSGTFHSGYMSEGTLVIVGGDTLKKANLCKQILENRFSDIGLQFEEILFENLGALACIPGIEKASNRDYPEIVFRVAAKSPDRKVIERFTREIAPLVLSGPPGITGYAGGKREVKEIFSFWPCLVSRSNVPTTWEIVDG